MPKERRSTHRERERRGRERKGGQPLLYLDRILAVVFLYAPSSLSGCTFQEKNQFVQSGLLEATVAFPCWPASLAQSVSQEDPMKEDVPAATLWVVAHDTAAASDVFCEARRHCFFLFWYDVLYQDVFERSTPDA